MSSVAGKYYQGGFAELVRQPSSLTFSYLQQWFCGAGSLGMAMEKLGLPYQPVTVSVLDVVDGELVVDLEREAATLYDSTVFGYSLPWQPSDSLTPKLTINWSKLLRPQCWLGTTQILLKQMNWISQPAQLLLFAHRLVADISEDVFATSELPQLEKKLLSYVWPNVIALGLLSEFFAQLVQQETKKYFPKIQSYLSHKQAKNDWFFSSIADQYLVKNKEMTLKVYLQKYGLRADQDYELSTPRLYEIPDEVKKRIADLPEKTLKDGSENERSFEEAYQKLSKAQRSHVDTWLELQTLRSEARRKALVGIDALRRALAPQLKEMKPSKKSTVATVTPSSFSQLGDGQIYQGVAVSAGVVSGVAKIVERAGDQIVSGSIGIFPAASPEFSGEYLKCVGLIFLQGGQTSHGSIVAREFGLPAVIDPQASAISNDQLLTLNGMTGQWFIGSNEHIFDTTKNVKKQANEKQKRSTSKAQTLQQLQAAGLPVPDFFVLSPKQLGEFQKANWSKSAEQEILEQFHALDCKLVAVRSSAIGEDSANAAWAGQLDSYLNVSSKELVFKIKECADSISNPHLLSYLEHHHLPTKDLKMSVIVQKMIKSEWAGVVFTADPVSGDQSGFIVEVVEGLGESLAQGTQEPSRFRIDKKIHQIVPLSSNGKKNQIPEELLLQLAGLADQIELLFGVPQDIEWASQAHRLYILQSRPITTSLD